MERRQTTLGSEVLVRMEWRQINLEPLTERLDQFPAIGTVNAEVAE
jgi:hypothetical protein